MKHIDRFIFGVALGTLRDGSVLWLVPGAAIAGVYMAAGKRMISLEAFVFGVGQSFCVLVISFLRVLATL